MMAHAPYSVAANQIILPLRGSIVSGANASFPLASAMASVRFLGSRPSNVGAIFCARKRVYILCSWKGAGFTESGTAGALNIVSALNTTSIKNSTFQKIATAPAATSRHSINSRGKTRAPTTMPRGGI